MPLPTWPEIAAHATDSLNTSRLGLSDARDWLASDWSPIGKPLTPAEAKARAAAGDCIAKAKALIDQAKNHLDTRM